MSRQVSSTLAPFWESRCLAGIENISIVVRVLLGWACETEWFACFTKKPERQTVAKENPDMTSMSGVQGMVESISRKAESRGARLQAKRRRNWSPAAGWMRRAAADIQSVISFER